MCSNQNYFICPECGSKKIKESFHYKKKSGNGLYSSVFYEIQCGSCYMDIPGILGERKNNISYKDARNMWIKDYKPEHLSDAAKCSLCNLYYYEIDKKLQLDLKKNDNIFMQKFTQSGFPDLICRICEPDNFK